MRYFLFPQRQMKSWGKQTLKFPVVWYSFSVVDQGCHTKFQHYILFLSNLSLFHKWSITLLDTSLKGSFSRSNLRTFGHYINLKEAKNCDGTISIPCTYRTHMRYTWWHGVHMTWIQSSRQNIQVNSSFPALVSLWPANTRPTFPL